uniref:Uncharacterized protein n=1 Tax=Nelumbo nucifera TaxID=4432 RepID=A0A822XE14_NELNU|nr:TPA_asm: hypothetical protein HUJ06_020033 [Nelumbo nucifera]
MNPVGLRGDRNELYWRGGQQHYWNRAWCCGRRWGLKHPERVGNRASQQQHALGSL